MNNSFLRKKQQQQQQNRGLLLLMLKYGCDKRILMHMYRSSLSDTLVSRLLCDPTPSQRYTLKRADASFARVRSSFVRDIGKIVSNQFVLLGRLYQSIPQSITYYKKAISFGNNDAVAEMVYFSLRSPDPRLRQHSFELLQERISDGCHHCFGIMGNFFENGIVNMDRELSFKLLTQSAEAGSLYGFIGLAKFLIQNATFDPNDDGIEIYEKDLFGVECGDDGGDSDCRSVECVCDSGDDRGDSDCSDVESCDDDCIEDDDRYFNKSSERKLSNWKQFKIAVKLYSKIIKDRKFAPYMSPVWMNACMDLGRFYHSQQHLFKGTVEASKQKAFQLFMMVAHAGYPIAIRTVSEMLRTGDGVSVDMEEAQYWSEQL